MSNIKFGLDLPQIGTSGNWGSTVNQNFIKVANEIQKIYQTINSAQSLIGANIPYINVDKERHYFVKVYHEAVADFTPNADVISGPEEGSLDNIACILKFYGTAENEENEPAITTYYYYKQSDNNHTLGWNPILPMYIASYVAGVYAFDENGNTQDMLGEVKIEQTSTLMPSWDKSDILVVVPEFGSIYRDNYTPSFKKYLPIGDYYIPSLNTKPYELKFTKTDFVSWYQKEKTSTYTLPAIGLGTFNSFSIERTAANQYSLNEAVTDGIWEFEVTPAMPDNATDPSQIAPKFSWYIKSGDKFQPVFIAYEYSYKQSTTNSQTLITYTIQVDVSNLDVNEVLYGEMYFNFKGEFKSNSTQGGSTT